MQDAINFKTRVNWVLMRISNYLITQPVEKAWIFGSFARSEENKMSDIDILVSFSSDSKVTLSKYAQIVNDLQKLTGKRIDLVENGQLKNFAEKNADNNKILIYERKAQGQ